LNKTFSKDYYWVLAFWVLLQVFAGSLVFAQEISGHPKSCPLLLQNLATSHLGQWSPCQVFESYQASLQKLKQKGVYASEYIAAWRGPRFINFPDWIKMALFTGYNPWYVYKPAPKTWQSWENGHALVYTQVQKNLKKQKVEIFDLEWIKKVHRVSMQDMYVSAGSIRNHSEVGLQLDRKYALPEATIQLLDQGAGYRSHTNPDEPMLEWIPTICWEDQDRKILETIEERKAKKESWFQKTEWTHPEKDLFFEEGGARKQCGYISYPASGDVIPELSNYLKIINNRTQKWISPDKNEDFLETIAKAQRLFIAIHPFKDGNGRMSRYLMDLLIESTGLPAPVLADMDNDLFVSEKDWAQELGRGIFRTLDILNQCAENPQRESCKIIPLKPEEILL
jgi:fido (protein-threonine AMPylation protein)